MSDLCLETSVKVHTRFKAFIQLHPGEDDILQKYYYVTGTIIVL